MVRNKSLKFGFSLAEVLISVLIISVFFAATAKIITKKPKKDKATTAHGYFECYQRTSGVFSHYKYEEFSQPEKPEAESCLFKPPRNVAFYNVNLIANGTVRNEIISHINRSSIRIVPGENFQNDVGETYTAEDMNNVGDSDIEGFITNMKVNYSDTMIYEYRSEFSEDTMRATFISW